MPSAADVAWYRLEFGQDRGLGLRHDMDMRNRRRADAICMGLMTCAVPAATFWDTRDSIVQQHSRNVIAFIAWLHSRILPLA